MALTTMLVVMLAAMSSCATAWTTCGPCKCYDGDHSWWGGLKVADCLQLPTLTSVPASLPADIQGLWINEGSITKLAENQFKSYRHLQKIRIIHNKISQIEQGAFRYMTNVTYISLWDNQITELPNDFLTYTPNITKVDLESNKIKRLQTNLFNNLKHLKTVWLDNNEITTIEDNCFNNVPQLEEIYLYNNKLISLDVNFIDNVNSLKHLLLYDNPWHCDASLCGVLDAVVRGALWGSRSVPTCTTPQSLTGRPWSKELQTELCPCSWCQCTVNPSAALCTEPRQLNHVPSHFPTDLVQLNLTGQNIPTVHGNDFLAFKYLQFLHLDNNTISTIESNAFNSLQSITTISLSHNKLTTLQKFVFANLSFLIEVDLSHNKILHIEDKCFVNTSSLEAVDLSSNHLQTLKLSIFDNASQLSLLALHGNPWKCNESLCEMMDAVVSRELWPGDKEPMCLAPRKLQAKPWSRILSKFRPAITSDVTSATAGDNVTLRCDYCFVSRVVWTFNGKNLPKLYQNISDLTSQLKLRNVGPDEQGNYACHVHLCENCKDDEVFLYVNPKNSIEMKEVVHIPTKPDNATNVKRGLLLLYYTFMPSTKGKTQTQSDTSQESVLKKLLNSTLI